MSLPLEGDAGHQLEGGGLPGPTGPKQQLAKVLRGDPGGHRAVGQGEHLVLGQPLLLLAILLLSLSRPLSVGLLLGVLLHILFDADQVLILLGVIGPKQGGGGPPPQAVHGLLQLLLRLQGGDLPPLTVIHDPQLIDIGNRGTLAHVVGLPLHPAENAPDTGDAGDHVPQHPLTAHAQLAEPRSVLLQVPVHHSEELLHRGRLVGIGELVPNGLGQRALLRVQGIPQAPVGQKNSNQDHARSQERAQMVNDTHLIVQALNLSGKRLTQIEKIQAEGPACHQKCRWDQTGQPPPGAPEAAALLRTVRLLLFVPPHNEKDQGNGKDAKHHRQHYVDDHIPGPSEVKSLWECFLRLLSFFHICPTSLQIVYGRSSRGSGQHTCRGVHPVSAQNACLLYFIASHM